MKFREYHPYNLPLRAGFAKLAKQMVEQYNQAGIVYPFKAPDLDLIGVEVEVENVGGGGFLSPWWKMLRDGSLRKGLEFKTHPISPAHLPYALHDLYRHLRDIEKNPKFTPRCSTHVHIDFREYTPTQLVSLIMCYLPFEKYLYEFAGSERFKSNFCVPLSEGDIQPLRTLVSFVEKKVDESMEGMGLFAGHILDVFPDKYSAFNILPLVGLGRNDENHEGSGSIEFRHMEGVNDPNKIITWVEMLMHLKSYAINTPFEKIKEQIISLNTTSKYQQFAEDVFGEKGRLLLPISVNWKMLAQGLRLTKEALAKEYIVPAKEFLRSPLAEHLQGKLEKRRGGLEPAKKAPKLLDPRRVRINWDNAVIAPNADLRGRVVVEDQPVQGVIHNDDFGFMEPRER